jgi:hypothetical protein
MEPKEKMDPRKKKIVIGASIGGALLVLAVICLLIWAPWSDKKKPTVYNKKVATRSDVDRAEKRLQATKNAATAARKSEKKAAKSATAAGKSEKKAAKSADEATSAVAAVKATNTKIAGVSDSAVEDCRALDARTRMTIMCKMIGSSTVVDVCAKRNQQRSPIKVRFLGELADYTPLKLDDSKDNPYVNLFPRYVSNKGMVCYIVPGSVLNGESYAYRSHRRSYPRGRKVRANSGTGNGSGSGNEYATKAYVDKAVGQERKERIAADDDRDKKLRNYLEVMLKRVKPQLPVPPNSGVPNT